MVLLVYAISSDKAATAHGMPVADALLWLAQEVWIHRHTLQPAVFSVLSFVAYFIWLGNPFLAEVCLVTLIWAVHLLPALATAHDRGFGQDCVVDLGCSVTFFDTLSS